MQNIRKARYICVAMQTQVEKRRKVNCILLCFNQLLPFFLSLLLYLSNSFIYLLCELKHSKKHTKDMRDTHTLDISPNAGSSYSLVLASYSLEMTGKDGWIEEKHQTTQMR
jgi:hypothetical protein